MNSLEKPELFKVRNADTIAKSRTLLGQKRKQENKDNCKVFCFLRKRNKEIESIM